MGKLVIKETYDMYLSIIFSFYFVKKCYNYICNYKIKYLFKAYQFVELFILD